MTAKLTPERRPVFSGKLSCWADTCRYYTGTADDKVLVMLSLYGPQNAVEAAWARLLLLRKKRGDKPYYGGSKGKLLVSEDKIRIDPENRPVTVKTSIAEGKTHLVCVDPALTIYHGANASFFYFADTPSQFRSRLGRYLNIPTHEDWNDWLWETGLKEELIQLLDGFGHKVYHVNSSTDLWLPVILNGLEQGQIS